MIPMFQEYDVVLLKQTTSTVSIPQGTRGTVLIVYPDNPPAYEVEFLDEAGNSLGTHTVRETDLKLVDDR